MGAVIYGYYNIYYRAGSGEWLAQRKWRKQYLKKGFGEEQVRDRLCKKSEKKGG